MSKQERRKNWQRITTDTKIRRLARNQRQAQTLRHIGVQMLEWRTATAVDLD